LIISELVSRLNALKAMCGDIEVYNGDLNIPLTIVDKVFDNYKKQNIVVIG